jgi:hypothetical protein
MIECQAVASAAAIFAIVHPPASVVPAFVLGLCAALVYEPHPHARSADGHAARPPAMWWSRSSGTRCSTQSARLHAGL